VAVLVGAALLVPIDRAMVAAQTGNLALDREHWSDARAAFDMAVGLHDLPIYRLGEAIALSHLGQPAAALAALERQAAAEPLTFVSASISRMQLQLGDAGAAAETANAVGAAGPYDPTATLNAAIVLSNLGSTTAASDLLSQVFVAVPSLLLTRPPNGTFDPQTWAAAADAALARIEAQDPMGAALLRLRRGDTTEADRLAASQPAGSEREMYGLLRTALMGGRLDLETARQLIRTGPRSQFLLNGYALLAHLAGSKVDQQAAETVSAILFFAYPTPDYAIQVVGATDGLLALRLANYPDAASSRRGPKQLYVAGMATIEPLTLY